MHGKEEEKREKERERDIYMRSCCIDARGFRPHESSLCETPSSSCLFSPAIFPPSPSRETRNPSVPLSEGVIREKFAFGDRSSL